MLELQVGKAREAREKEGGRERRGGRGRRGGKGGKGEEGESVYFPACSS